jgi:phytoene dehydrogenase-like protein
LPALRALLLLGLSLVPSQAFAADDAKRAAEDFYRGYSELRASGMTGVPDDAQLTMLSPLLAPELTRALAAAKREQQRCMKKFPDDKPPRIEGDIFSSSFEGFTSFAAGPSKPRGRGRDVSMQFTFADGKDRTHWTDVLILVNANGRWLVSDVYYRAKFAFTSGFGSHLRGSLKGIHAC